MQEAPDRPPIANLLGLARSAQMAGNAEEAISYYNRTLEFDPTISEAWSGKAACVGQLSSLASPRFNEMTVAFGHAIACAPEDQRPSTAFAAQARMFGAVVGLYGRAKSHRVQFSATPNATAILVAVGAAGLDALEQTSRWTPPDRTMLEAIVMICRETIDLGVSPDYAAVLAGKMESAVLQLKVLDPSYVPPEPPDLGVEEVTGEPPEAPGMTDLTALIVVAAIVLVLVLLNAGRP